MVVDAKNLDHAEDRVTRVLLAWLQILRKQTVREEAGSQVGGLMFSVAVHRYGRTQACTQDMYLYSDLTPSKRQR